MSLSAGHGVEPNPRAALDSVGDQDGTATNEVVHDVMEPHLTHRIDFLPPVQTEAQHKTLALEEGDVSHLDELGGPLAG